MTQTKEFLVPNNEKEVLLHSCCAPCAGDLMEKMQAAEIKLTILFYNPNIHPKNEYEIRKSENKRFADKMNIPCIDLDYDVQNWFARAKGMEQ
jgi:predicted adenine nucleotide alpha hydrolase (AANH) superfamily ATPase